MKIAIDASRTTVERVTGTEHYAIALIREMIRENTQHELTLYFRDPPPDDLFPASDNVRYGVIPFKRVWTHLRFAGALWRDRPDVTFVPAHTLPFVMPGKAAVTIHDLGYKYFPEAHPSRQRLYLDLTTRYSASRAALVFADSQATADDLTRFYGIAPSKIHVVYPGVEKPPIGDLAATRQKYTLPERYFLFVGTLQPRKNIARLVQAYARYRAQVDSPAGLVLAGGKGWLYDDAWVQGVEGIHITGYISDAEKGALMSGAQALVFPSLFEGFGFPVIEAMLCETPVIASNTSSLPELVGDAGLLVDPLDVDSIASALVQIDHDDALSKRLIERGMVQAKQFTWVEAAGRVLSLLGK